MSVTIVTCEQRSPEWYAARCGRLTSSRVDEMLTNPRKGATESITRRDLRIEIACERLTGFPHDTGNGFRSDEMRRGMEKEPDAIRAYEAATGLIVKHTGFLQHDTLPVGCSLDGHVGDFTGIVEVKCPKMATHYEYLREKAVPTEYLRQITHHLWISGAQWADFVSYDDRFPLALRLLRIRVHRADVDLKAYELAVSLFLAEIDRECGAILGLIQKAA